jgi:hypothetical protein
MKGPEDTDNIVFICGSFVELRIYSINYIVDGAGSCPKIGREIKIGSTSSPEEMSFRLLQTGGTSSSAT